MDLQLYTAHIIEILNLIFMSNILAEDTMRFANFKLVPSLKDFIITDSAMWIKGNVRSPSYCFVACMEDTSCKSVFYKKLNMECTGHSSVHTSVAMATDDPGSHYYVNLNPAEVYQPDLLHLTVEDTHDGDLSVRHARPNVSLHHAIVEGRLKTVQFILSQRPDDINARDKYGRTPVMAAVMKNQVTVFDFLVSKSCDLLAVDNNKDTVLHLACAVGNVDTVRELVVTHTCDIESRGRAGMTPVMVAVRCGHLSVVKYPVSKGCNLTIVDNTENNILHIACMCGRLDMVKYIISQQKVSVDSKGHLGRTAVMLSANIGRFDIFSYLVNNKCNLGIVDNFRNDILHFACFGGNLDIVKHVFSDQRKYSRGFLGQTPVMTAVVNSHLSVVMYLTGKGCKLTVPNNAGDTILHVACVRGHLNMVKYILSQQKISINSKGKYRRTPVMAAAYFGYLDVVQYLVEKGCGLEEVDDKGNNVLALACKFPRKDVVNYLIGINSWSETC